MLSEAEAPRVLSEAEAPQALTEAEVLVVWCVREAKVPQMLSQRVAERPQVGEV